MCPKIGKSTTWGKINHRLPAGAITGRKGIIIMGQKTGFTVWFVDRESKGMRSYSGASTTVPKVVNAWQVDGKWMTSNGGQPIESRLPVFDTETEAQDYGDKICR